jgi:hypothetical protein
MPRTAQCACGRLRIIVEGEPLLVAACHCDFCQKRTGSIFAAQALFSDSERARVDGESACTTV